MVGQLPIKKFRSGSVDCSIWSNKREIEREGEKVEVEFKTVSLRKSWEKDGKWHDSTINLRKNDIARVIMLLQKVQEEVLLSKEKGEEKEKEKEGV